MDEATVSIVAQDVIRKSGKSFAAVFSAGLPGLDSRIWKIKG